MTLDFKPERDADFLTTYKAVLKSHGKAAPYLKKEALLHQTILQPARRFYVSEEQCMRIIGATLKGNPPAIKNPLKQLMYHEILIRVKNEKESSNLPLVDIIHNVVNQPAPRFYLTLESAQLLLYKILKPTIQ